MPDSQHCSVGCTAQPAVSSLAILPGPLVPNCNACVRQHSPCLTPGAPPATPADHTSCFTCCYLCSNTSQPRAEGFVMPGCGGSGTCNKCRNFDAARSSSFGARSAQVLLTVTNQSHHADLLQSNQAFSVWAGGVPWLREVPLWSPERLLIVHSDASALGSPTLLNTKTQRLPMQSAQQSCERPYVGAAPVGRRASTASTAWALAQRTRRQKGQHSKRRMGAGAAPVGRRASTASTAWALGLRL